MIAIRIEFVDGKITGKFATINCFGIEKVNRTKERFDLSEYSYIYTYGDSSGDKVMLSISIASYFKYFA
jgi:phosphatidylglycerophosphatase C